MKFDKFPYAKRPMTEVFVMDWLLPIFIALAISIFLAWAVWSIATIGLKICNHVVTNSKCP